MSPLRSAILLDTNALLRLVSSPDRIAAPARAVMTDPQTQLYVSAASAWEITTRSRLGRLDGEPLLSAWADVMADMTATELAIESADAILAGRLTWEHKDPFDRMIVAQAVRRNLPIATRDDKILNASLTPTIEV